MAKSRKAARASEAGLSLIEALVVVTITAVLALLLLPMVTSSSQRNYGRAQYALDDMATSRAELEWRALLRAAQQQSEGNASAGLVGESDRLLIAPALGETLGCALSGGAAIEVAIVREGRGGKLRCTSAAGQADLLIWDNGGARFAYSADGASWSPTWRDAAQEDNGGVVATRTAPLVKFELAIARRQTVTWIERAGAAEPVDFAETGQSADAEKPGAPNRATP